MWGIVKNMEKEKSIENLKPKLVLPSIKYKDSYVQALREYQQFDGEITDINEIENDFDSFLKKLEQNNKGLVSGRLPQTKYWCIDGNKYIGDINYRPVLNKTFEFRGGNIGYSVRPSERRKGYALMMLKEILGKARTDGLSSVMLSCDSSNVGSKKVIEGAGGIYKESDIDNGEKFDRYIIKI